MKSSQSGKNCRLLKGGKYAPIFWKNCKLELLIIAIMLIWLKESWRMPRITQVLEGYFEESRCSGISGIASVIIGIYVTVWSIFATSVSKINFEILKQRIEGQLFFLIAVGIAESFLVTVTCVFIPYDVPHYAEIVMLFTTLTITSFVKFVVIVMTITKLNIKYIVQEIDSQNEKCTEARVKLDEIYHRTLNKEKKS